MADRFKNFIFFYFCCVYVVSAKIPEFSTDAFEPEDFVFWPNGTIPFYIYPTHFDEEQSLAILSVLSYFTFKTCLQFRPVMVEPSHNQHVLVFENPAGVRKCTVGMEGHGRDEAHRIILGYDCLKSPHIDMLVMKALGFPFEHNRASRDIFIDVLFENIQPGAIPLFTKEKILPTQLRALPYDINSVLHFGEREYSKNGHRTIMFKNGNTKQNRVGLTKSDLRKIEIVYGPQCQERDRQAKIDTCKNFPVSRRKRELDLTVRSLRVNRDITPPPEMLTDDDLTNSVRELGIEEDINDLIDQVHKITAKALNIARDKHCNETDKKVTNNSKEFSLNYDITKIIEVVRDYTKSLVDNAKDNLSVFCKNASDIDFLRFKCGWGQGRPCPVSYKSTKSGPIKYSTQHRPIIKQSTKAEIKSKKHHLDLRTNNTDVKEERKRRKRDLTNVTDYITVTDKVDVTDNTTASNVTLEATRRATTIVHKKVVNFAPVRRFGERIFSSLFGNKEDSEDIKDASNVSDERPKKIVTPHNKKERRKDRKREKPKDAPRDDEDEKINRNSQEENNRDSEERPKPKRQKKRHGKRTDVPETVELSKENKEFYAERVWPDGIVRYVIEENDKYDLQDMRSRLAEVNNILKRKTCVRIEEVSEDEALKYQDYLVLDTSPFYVTGRVGGKQNFGCIELFEGGQHQQHAAMMVMAMLGFYFEVSRHDRDKFIRVHNRHIRPDKLHYFEKIRSDATLSVPYDYESATHPAWQFWRKVGKKGISSVATYKDQDPDGSVMKSLGQNGDLLSVTDILRINSVYGVKCFQNQRRAEIKL